MPFARIKQISGGISWCEAVSIAVGIIVVRFNNSAAIIGEIAEILVYDRVLSTPERQTVEAYLYEKYVTGP